MLVSCPHCRAEYDLKDEFIGKTLECQNCKSSFTANPKENLDQEEAVSSIITGGKGEEKMVSQGIFGKHKYGIKQKKIAINEKYYVKDENNNDLFFSIRRVYFWRRFGAILVSLISIIAGFVLGSFVFLNIESQILGGILMIGAIILGLFGAIFITSVAGRRGIEFYMSEEDLNKNDSKFSITQDNLYELIHKHFTLKHNDEIIAQFDKNVFTDILRKKWHIYTQGKHFLIKEESVVLGILRRLGIPFIRTNFIFLDVTTDPKSNVIIGYFKRKFEIFDNYLLDMSGDPAFSLPREVAICMAILLDCGERR